MKCRYSVIIFLVGILASIFLRCSTSQLAGDVTETGNAKVLGTIVSTDGIPAKEVQVLLIPSSYNPTITISLADSFIDTTDAWGQYSFNARKNTTYNLQARHLNYGTRLLHPAITIADDTVDGLLDTLRIPGTIEVFLPPTIGSRQGFVFIQGTNISKLVDTNVVFIDSVPAGKIPAIYYTDNTENILLNTTMSVVSGDTMIAAKALLIVRNDTGNVALCNTILQNRLEESGLYVVVKDENVVTSQDTAEFNLVVLSTTIFLHNEIAEIFKSASVPLVTTEVYILYSLGMTDSIKDIDFGTLSHQIDYSIVDSMHPVAAGFSGSVPVYTTLSTINWGRPSDDASIVTAVPGETEKSQIFCYNKNDLMVRERAAAKRGAYLLVQDYAKNVNADGWQLFHNMIHWVLE